MLCLPYAGFFLNSRLGPHFAVPSVSFGTWNIDDKLILLIRPSPKGRPLQSACDTDVCLYVCGHSLRLGMSKSSNLALGMGNKSNDWMMELWNRLEVNCL